MIIREHENENENSVQRKEAFYRRQHEWTCLVLRAMSSSAGKEGFIQGLQGETHERIPISSAADTRTLCVPEQTAGNCFFFFRKQ